MSLESCVNNLVFGFLQTNPAVKSAVQSVSGFASFTINTHKRHGGKGHFLIHSRAVSRPNVLPAQINEL